MTDESDSSDDGTIADQDPELDARTETEDNPEEKEDASLGLGNITGGTYEHSFFGSDCEADENRIYYPARSLNLFQTYNGCLVIDIILRKEVKE